MIARPEMKIGFFLKTCKTEGYARDLLNGKLYCNRVSHYRMLGDDRGGDTYEGAIPAPGGLYTCQWIERLHVYCMYAGMSDMDSLTEGDLDDLVAQLRPSARLSTDFGKFVVAITDVPAFLVRLRKAFYRNYLMYFGGPIVYFEDNEVADWFALNLLNFPPGPIDNPTTIQTCLASPIGIKPAMSKRSKFAYQKEYRLVFDTATGNRTDPLVFDLGCTLTDIAHITTIDDVRATLKVSR